MIEEWRPIPEWEQLYSISDKGRVRSEHRVIMRRDGKPQTIPETILKPRVNKYGYVTVGLTRDSKKTLHKLHRLLATTFIPNPDNLPLVRHLNDIRTDNRLENLAWGTHLDNTEDRRRNGYVAKRVSHCKRGHEFSEENTYYVSTGSRQCIACRREREKKRRIIPIPDGSPRHGTLTGYTRHKCRCEKCYAAYTKARKDLEFRRRKTGLSKDDPRHGTPNGYKHYGCKCGPCREAQREYVQKKREAIRDAIREE